MPLCPQGHERAERSPSTICMVSHPAIRSAVSPPSYAPLALIDLKVQGQYGAGFSIRL